MIRKGPDSGLYVVYGAVVALLFGFIPWFLIVPRSVISRLGGGEYVMLGGMVLGLLVGCAYARLRYGSDEIAGDEKEVWYFARGQAIWGGKWDELAAQRQALRVWLIDPQGRGLLLEHLSLFSGKQSFAANLRKVTRLDPPKQMKRSGFFLSLLALAVGLVLAPIAACPFHEKLNADEGLVMDAGFWLLLFGTVSSHLLVLGGMLGAVLFVPTILSEKWKDTLMMGSKVVGTLPVEMEPGVRYAYLRPDVLKRRMPPAWKVHLIMSPMYLGCLSLALFPNQKGQSAMGPGLILFAMMLAVGWLIGRDSARWNTCADDEFELTRDGELIVYRRGSSWRLRKVSKKPFQTPKPNWGSWYETFSDGRTKHRLDSRYLVKARP